jgi:putative hydrolase of the HAD superfamily
MIKALIFDVGGVLIRTEDRAPRAAWEQRLSLPAGEADELVFHSARGQAAQRGEIDDEGLWTWIGDFLALEGENLESFRRDFWAGDRLDYELLGFIRTLRPRYQTAVISNVSRGMRQTLNTKYPLADAFDLIVCSAEEGVMKPDAAIYERTLARLGRRPQEAVFIDDSPANVAGARSIGISAIQFSESAGLIAQLRALGVTAEEVHE